MRAPAFVPALVAMSLLAACAETNEREPTAVVVAIDAESMVRASVNEVRVEIASGSSRDDLEKRTEERFELDDGAHWPLTLTLLPKTKGTDVFRIWVRAQRDGEEISELRVISGFAAQRVLLLEVLLPDECIGMLGCGEDKTCMVDDDGVTLCGDADVPVASLVPFTEKVIDRLRRDGGSDEPDPDPEDSGTPNNDGGEPAPDGGDEPVPDGGEPIDRERCDNGADDDHDGDVDCADDDCEEGFVCLPMGDEIAVMLTDLTEGCPDGFEEVGVVSNDLLSSNRCTGCDCSTEQAAGCQAPIYFFDSQDACVAAGADSAGLFVGYAVSTDCGNPIGAEEDLYSPFGWRVGDIAPITPASCDASGSPELPEPHWRRSRKLCIGAKAPTRNGGCDDGEVCAPRAEIDSGLQCTLLPAGEACPGGGGDDWYEGYRDERDCGACSCALQGGSCDGVTARLGSDYVCDVSEPSFLGENSGTCFGGSSVYSPPVDVIGDPTAASCLASSSTVGEIELLGGHRVCCP